MQQTAMDCQLNIFLYYISYLVRLYDKKIKEISTWLIGEWLYTLPLYGSDGSSSSPNFFTVNPNARKSCRCRWVRKPCGWSWETSWEPLMWWAPGKWEFLRDESRWTPNCNPRSWIKMSSFRTFDALDALDIFGQKVKTVLIDSGRPRKELQRSTQTITNTNVSDHFLLDIEVLHAVSLQGFHLPFIDSPGGPRYRHLAARGFTAVIRWNEVYCILQFVQSDCLLDVQCDNLDMFPIYCSCFAFTVIQPRWWCERSCGLFSEILEGTCARFDCCWRF